VTLVFHANSFTQELLFSTLSFLRAFLVFYFWLLALAIVNRRSKDSDPFHKLLLLQLGRAGQWPPFVQTILPMLVIATLWLLIHPVLVRTGTIKATQSTLHMLEQASLVGGGVFLTLKFLLPAFLFLHVITSYVYLGTSAFWDFIAVTARNLLHPLNRLPLRLGKVDFAPLIEILLIVLLLHALPVFIQIQLSQRNLTIWPP
jgi:uncharacterized protein YggT (Ycf19 family)